LSAGLRSSSCSVSAGRVFPPPGRVAPAPAPVVPPGVVRAGRGRPPPPVVRARRTAAAIVRTGAAAPVSASSVSASSVPAARGGSAHVHARGRGVGSLRDGEVHADLPPVQLGAGHGVAGLGGVLDVLEVDESEASATSGVSVQDDLDLLERSVPLELGLQLSLAGVEAQTEHSQTLAGLWGVPGALVTPPVGHRRPGVVTAVLAVSGPGARSRS